ncbi:LysR family transcriptional regulator [Kribbella sandramycini]|uniref:DNA-binding transcriptional LysR family regulator n=1 Tax=Kribbella sandramycini TaxID=60450 RepID=A0A7Y4L2A7_9ACTN|nr:LysR family transcriptional regulator [Kribbella sandramycini]MBB6566302.1 DNA-binding transcriptional LysR family regulator [Kribbella sandramycini]NOL43035.1 LysR family transcriptional regulator [Kribbella sandramycini]
MLTERHLQIFVALAEEQHFGDAARVVGITQPPLSQGLRRLEALIGAKLFERGSGGVELTAAGAALLPFARRALGSIDEFRQAAVARDGEGPEIRLGLAPEVPPAAGAAIAAACGTALPGSRVTVVSGPTSSLVSQVSAGRLTLAVVLHPAVLDGLEAGPVRLLPTWALVPGDGDGESALSDLGGLPIAVRPRAEAPAARDLFLDTLALHRPDGGTVVVTDDRAALAMAAAGQAILVTADPLLAAPGVGRRRLTGDPLPTRLRLVWSRTRTPFARPADVMGQLTEALS